MMRTAGVGLVVFASGFALVGFTSSGPVEGAPPEAPEAEEAGRRGALPVAVDRGDAPDRIPNRIGEPELATRAWDGPPWRAEGPHLWIVEERLQKDLAALRTDRPGYPFWRHVFEIPDGRVAFGSGEDGRLFVTFPTRGDWKSEARWVQRGLEDLLDGEPLPRRLSDRRRRVAELLETRVGPVVHNPTRGRFLDPGVERYGAFVDEWGAIFERFGVPAEIGLAQALVESGLRGRIRSEWGALGLCQWLPRNWRSLKRLSPVVIEGYNQTTQAAYCAAYLQVLATKYGSFIPALSEHHAGGTNVGRALIIGERLGAEEVREQYFRGGRFILDVREISVRKYRHLVRTYGRRSYYYTEMVFANAPRVEEIRARVPQATIHAMRAPRDLPLDEIAQQSGLSVEELQRFNPSLLRQVPRGANLYLPERIEAFGPDVSFWHRPPDSAFAAVLEEFVALDRPYREWERPSFLPVLEEFRKKFEATESEEGRIMATVLAYVKEIHRSSRQGEILAEYRSSDRIERLFHQAVAERVQIAADAAVGSAAAEVR